MVFIDDMFDACFSDMQPTEKTEVRKQNQKETELSLSPRSKMMHLADQLRDAKEHKRELEAQVKAINTEIEQLDHSLSDMMTELECESFTHAGSTFYLSSRLFVSPQSGRKEALFTALRENGYGSIVTETVNANTLASFVKERMEENDGEIPEWLTDVVNTHEKISVGVRKK